ncbi:uncharacterized protein LOC119655558 [Hermetia illucens]|uniref:uncharacterized protein LOC119655558 n=1 Tax=Hermetia illucens TaxID=343691 RepID=UPI0018CC0A22|nr:uncharacterized protein LOC119655558 [Hermetia illucens]
MPKNSNQNSKNLTIFANLKFFDCQKKMSKIFGVCYAILFRSRSVFKSLSDKVSGGRFSKESFYDVKPFDYATSQRILPSSARTHRSARKPIHEILKGRDFDNLYKHRLIDQNAALFVEDLRRGYQRPRELRKDCKEYPKLAGKDSRRVDGKRIRLIIGIIGLFIAMASAYHLREEAAKERQESATHKTGWKFGGFRR